MKVIIGVLILALLGSGWWVLHLYLDSPDYLGTAMSVAGELAKQRTEDTEHDRKIEEIQSQKKEVEDKLQKAEDQSKRLNRLYKRARRDNANLQRELKATIAKKEASRTMSQTMAIKKIEVECPEVVPLFKKEVEAANSIIADLKKALASERSLRIKAENTLREEKVVVSMQSRQIELLNTEITEYKDYVKKLKNRRFRFTPLAIVVGGGFTHERKPAAVLAVGVGITF